MFGPGVSSFAVFVSCYRAAAAITVGKQALCSSPRIPFGQICLKHARCAPGAERVAPGLRPRPIDMRRRARQAPTWATQVVSSLPFRILVSNCSGTGISTGSSCSGYLVRLVTISLHDMHPLKGSRERGLEREGVDGEEGGGRAKRNQTLLNFPPPPALALNKPSSSSCVSLE